MKMSGAWKIISRERLFTNRTFFVFSKTSCFLLFSPILNSLATFHPSKLWLTSPNIWRTWRRRRRARPRRRSLHSEGRTEECWQHGSGSSTRIYVTGKFLFSNHFVFSQMHTMEEWINKRRATFWQLWISRWPDDTHCPKNWLFNFYFVLIFEWTVYEIV